MVTYFIVTKKDHRESVATATDGQGLTLGSHKITSGLDLSPSLHNHFLKKLLWGCFDKMARKTKQEVMQ